ncbi:MAG: sugar transferase [Planctomycetes bacterium]|nr:sugar transferase [Planctomycetota bacterium]
MPETETERFSDVCRQPAEGRTPDCTALRAAPPASSKIKRLFDILLSLTGLLVGLPVIAIVALAIAVRMGRPVFFKQSRPGLCGRLFSLVKFRTMCQVASGTNAEAAVASDAVRLTGLGRFLRATSLDELPQLWNVLTGDMSLIGPRPLLPEYLSRYDETQARRHEVRPGITGWAQVNGRNAISWEKRFELDVWYVDNWSLLLDLKIVALTVLKVLSRKDISQEGNATMSPFQGTVRREEGCDAE